MTIKTDMDNLKQRMFRIETVVWIVAGMNGIKLVGDGIQVVSAMLG